MLTMSSEGRHLRQNALNLVTNRGQLLLDVIHNVRQLELVNRHSGYAGQVDLGLLGHRNVKLRQLQSCQIFRLHLNGPRLG
jgi:hypothetical protein